MSSMHTFQGGLGSIITAILYYENLGEEELKLHGDPLLSIIHCLVCICVRVNVHKGILRFQINLLCMTLILSS